MKRLQTLLTFCSAGGMLLGGHAAPAAASSTALEEIVVTARKREESLQDTPVAVTALGGEALRAAQINSLEDVVKEVPGLTARDGRKDGSFSIRGVGTRFDSLQLDPGVGIYVDGIFIPRGDSQILDVVNTESLQVLRGPQGTLFGKNTAGGAILMTSKKPTEEFEGFVDVIAGNRNRLDGTVGVGGPLIEGTLAASVVLDARSEDGYFDDAETGREYGDTDRQSALAQVRWTPSDELTIDLLALKGKIRENAAPNTCRMANPTAGLSIFTAPGETRLYAHLCAQSEALAEDEEVLMDRNLSRFEMDNELLGLTVNWEVGDFQLKSITGYLGQEGIMNSSDSDASPLLALSNNDEVRDHWLANGRDPMDQSREFYSQEFNLVGSAFDDQLDFTVGVFGSEERIDDVWDGLALGPGGVIGIPTGEEVLVLGAIEGLRDLSLQEFENSSWAVFGQAIYYINHQWQLTLGARYTEETKRYTQINYTSTSTQELAGIYSREAFDALENFTHGITRTGEDFHEDESWNEFSPAVTLSMAAPDSWTESGWLSDGSFYLSVSDGFKAGGYSSFGNQLQAFDPETLRAYEFGFKLDLLDNQMRLNGAVYMSEYNDIQLQVVRETGFDPETGVRSFASGLTNAADADIYGAELEFTWLFAPGWITGFTGSYIKAEYNEFDDISQVEGEEMLFDRSDEEFSYLPEQTYSWYLQYEHESELGLVGARLSGYYKDEVYMGTDVEAVENPVSYLEDYTLWNASISYRPANFNNLDIALLVENLLDEDYFASGGISVNGVGSAFLIPGKPRSYAVQLRYQF